MYFRGKSMTKTHDIPASEARAQVATLRPLSYKPDLLLRAHDAAVINTCLIHVIELAQHLALNH